MNRSKTSGRLSAGSADSSANRTRKPGRENNNLRCPACGRVGTIFPSDVVTAVEKTGLKKVTGKVFNLDIKHRLKEYLNKRTMKQGIPLLWKKYYCSKCGGHFDGEVLFVAWFTEYGKKLLEQERNKTINR